MKSLFVCGALQYVPLLSVVLARAPEDLDICEAYLPDHSVHGVRDQAFTTIVMGGDGAHGLLVSGLSEHDIARLIFHEGGIEFTQEQVTVLVNDQKIQTNLRRPKSDLWPAADPWDMESWTQTWGPMTLYAAQEIMGYFGARDLEDVPRLAPMIHARATSKARARGQNLALSPGGLTDADVTVQNVTRPYLDFFAIDEYDLSFRRYDGGQSDMVRRAVFMGTDAVIVLPYDPVRDRILLIEQFRPGPFARGDQRPWQLEPIAGRVDSGEDPKETAHREAREEARLSLNALHEVAHCYASPGCSTEFYNIYVGLADLPDGTQGVAGLASEAEDIRSYLFDFDELMHMVDTMQAVNAPLVLAALWLARHRDRLRAQLREPN